MKEAVKLHKPVKRGNESIKEISVRKPNAGELRGCNLINLLQMDVDTLVRILPRVTVPSLTEQDVKQLEPADLLKLGSEVSNFLVPTPDTPEESPAG